MIANNYAKMLIKIMPRAIENDEEYERISDIAWKFAVKGEENLTPDESMMLELLSTLIEAYDTKHMPDLSDITPIESLKFLMEESDTKPLDLLPIFKSKGYLYDVLNGKQQISKRIAKELAERFRVSTDLFL